MNFLDKYNKDDVFFRGLLIGLLNSLNNQITYFQTDKEGKVKEIFIPFFASLAGDESFLQDHYLSYEDCDGNPAFAEGNYDVIPRGIIEYNSTRINTTSSTNKYVRATYEKELPIVNGGAEVKAYSSYMVPIPLEATCTLKIKVDTIIDAFKIQARTIEVLFKNYVYYFEYDGFRIPVQVSLPDIVPEKTPNQFNFTYGSSQGEGLMLTTSVNIETYLPQKDMATERFRGNLMQAGIKAQTTVGNTTDDSGKTILKGIDIVLSSKTVLPDNMVQNNIQ